MFESKSKDYTPDEDRWHAEIFYSLAKENVTPADLQEMGAEKQSPCLDLRRAKIRHVLDQHDAVDQLPSLAARCAMVPELLMADHPTDHAGAAIARRRLLCAIQSLLIWGIAERKGPPGAFRLTEKGEGGCG